MDEGGSLSSHFLNLVRLQIRRCPLYPVTKFYWFKDLSELRLSADDHLSAQETDRVSNAQHQVFGSHPINVRTVEVTP